MQRTEGRLEDTCLGDKPRERPRERDSEELKAEHECEHRAGAGWGLGGGVQILLLPLQLLLKDGQAQCHVIVLCLPQANKYKQNDSRFQSPVLLLIFFLLSFKWAVLDACPDWVDHLGFAASAMVSSGVDWGSLWRWPGTQISWSFPDTA